MAGGICPQNGLYWCPLQGDSCESIDASCVLLVAGTGSDKLLATHILKYLVTAGKMALVNLETGARVEPGAM